MEVIKLLVSVEFRHNNEKWDWNSGINKVAIDYYPEKETIHELVQRICATKEVELTHKGLSLGYLFYEDEEGNRITNGYAYRGKSEFYDRGMTKPIRLYWSIFVHIARIVNFDFEKDSVRIKKSSYKELPKPAKLVA
jgi:hypothetical protein